MSPTQRSIALAKTMGYRVAIVEKWNPWGKVRQDLFGFGDLLLMKPHMPLLAIQACVTGDIAKREAKIKALGDVPLIWLSTGAKLAIWGWSKKGPRGKRKVWTMTSRVMGERHANPSDEEL